jgi:hydroxyacylglutathione hydrolase
MNRHDGTGYGLRKHALEVPFMRGDNISVHIYDAVLNNKLVLFDNGPETEQARHYLVDNIGLDHLSYVFITHCHPDHCGLMSFLHKEVGTRVVVSRYDVLRYEHLHARLAALPGILGPLDFPAEEIARLQNFLAKFDQETPLLDDYQVLENSAALLDELGLDYLHCPGHSQSDIVYLFGDYVITGDVVLHDLFTTPLLGVDYENLDRRYASYAAYCETIVKFKGLEDRTLLSSHLKPLKVHRFGIVILRDQIQNSLLPGSSSGTKISYLTILTPQADK